MSRRPNQVGLVDSGFWYAVFDERDQYHADAQDYMEIMLDFQFIVPWPVVYETLRTRYVRREAILKRFERVLRRPNAVLLDDSPYRAIALEATLSAVGKRYSIVDNVLRLILEDVNLRVKILFSFNQADFRDICVRRQIEMIRS
jgi:predicted nucleic acid-binding protein